MENIKINYHTKNSIFNFLPKVKSNYELVSNLNNDIKYILCNGCMYYPHLLADNNDYSLFNKIKEELCNQENIIDWSKHHKIDNPTNSSTFNLIIDSLQDYFKIEVLATRLNYYTNTDYKPFHHDSHAYTNGQKENITIGLSLGSARRLAFKHVETGNIFHFPQNNGDVFCFDQMTNKVFQHGILKENHNPDSLRFSIIIWGFQRKTE